MAENFEETKSGTLDVQQLLGIIRRRYIPFLIPLFVGFLAVWGTSWVLPPRYRSATLILVEQPTMPKDYVTPNITDNLQERLQSITEQILSRTRLLQIIDELGLYSDGSGHANPDAQVESMRKDIEIDLVRDASRQVTAFHVYYSAKDPRVAQEVTGKLTNLFINENLEVRQQQSEGTTKFLENQLETARQSLSEQEEKIREFKAQHVGELPTQLNSNLQILSGLQAQMQTESDALNTAKQQKVYLESLLNQYRTLRSSTSNVNAPMGLPALDHELDRLKAQLADLSSRYTENHPDVRKLKDQIAKTENMRSQLIADLNSKGGTAQAASKSTADADERDQADLSAPMVQMQGQLQANQAEIANRERAITEVKGKINDYQARLNQEPVREQQLADLTRGYDQSKANYDELLKKRNESAMATSMELLQQGERFHVLDPPSLPLKPDFPNRMRFCGIGIGVGLALGLVVAGAFEMMDDRIHDEKQLTQMLPVAVICELPEIVTQADDDSRRRTLWFGWATAAFVFTVILAGSAISYFHG
jgi:polysaccharide chain length determinant protein (PEP-CTERM system associated)